MKFCYLPITFLCIVALTQAAEPDCKDYKGKPWQNTPQTIPGKIVGAFYDTGGEGVAYHDVDTKNNGSGSLNKGPEEKNNFRKDEAVDVSYTKAAFDKFTDGTLLDIDQYYVGWTSVGEWLNYTIQVKTEGAYIVNLLASSNNQNAEISLSINGIDKTGPIVLESTGHWHKWKMYNTIAEIKLDKGPQVLTLKFLKEGNMNVQHLEFAPKPAADIAKPSEYSEPKWKLIWSDEFDGDTIDRKKWDFDIGNGAIPGWGNNELEYYTDRAENAFVKDGMLHLVALKEAFRNSKYTSARLKTRKEDKTPLFSKLYGRYEFRAKVSTGKGIWPAIWLLPQDEKYKGWAASGEMDILEARGQEPGKVLGTLHYGSGWPGNVHTGKDYLFPDKGTIADFHVYALEWEPSEIRWFVDGKLYQTQNFWWSSSKRNGKGGAKPESETDLNPWPAPFDHAFYLIFNVAVGGQFLGHPDANTVFPAEMVVDYVRVYDKEGGYGPLKARGTGKLPFDK